MSVSVDLDPVECYWRIHAIPGAPPPQARHAILRRCLPRFAELFARHGARATFFVVARDLDEDAEGRALLAQLARDGHELASHTYSHPYDLVRLPSETIVDEIDRAHGLIGACAGAAPCGFRAPGYAVSAEIIDLLRARAYRYDSSAFPSAAYYGAKAAVMGALRVVGRKSSSILDTPRVLAAPRAPYRPAAGAPYRKGDLDIVELPMAVTAVARLPVIGTSLVTAPAWLRRHLVTAALRAPFFNLELHGIDLADAEADEIPPALVARQPDLRRPLAHKLRALDETLTAARAAGARFARLDEVAAAFAAR
ncbi:MAG TPA: polysaccharide deacetylase family protein [Polyangia bacterium]|nr:polysaccharide deacetylase family protein [Polyangia bacterium]